TRRVCPQKAVLVSRTRLAKTEVLAFQQGEQLAIAPRSVGIHVVSQTAFVREAKRPNHRKRGNVIRTDGRRNAVQTQVSECEAQHGATSVCRVAATLRVCANRIPELASPHPTQAESTEPDEPLLSSAYSQVILSAGNLLLPPQHALDHLRGLLTGARVKRQPLGDLRITNDRVNSVYVVAGEIPQHH